MSSAEARRVLRAAPALLGAAGVVNVLLLAYYSRPIADDWSALGPQSHFAIGSSGRYSAEALVWAATRLFGTASSQLTPLIVLLAIWFAGIWALRGISRLADLGSTAWERALLALLTLVGCVALAPSEIDNVAWLAGVGGYTASLAAMFGLAALCLQLRVGDTRRPWPAAVAALAAGFLTSGFDELTGAILLAASVFALATVRSLHGGRALLLTLAGGGIGAGGGLAVNLLSSAARRRAASQRAHVDLLAAVHASWHDLSFMTAPLSGGQIGLVLGCGIIAWQVLGQNLTGRARRWMFGWSAFLIVVPWLIVSALCAWANATESGDRAPFRAAFLFTTLGGLGVVLLAVALLSGWPGLLKQAQASALALALIVGGLVALSEHTVPLIRAEQLRATALTQRSRSIKQQISEGSTEISVMPAPLLAVNTQALDLSFAGAARQRPALVDLVRSYYEIPASDSVRVISRQPKDYCLSGVSASWVGVRSCQQLQSGR